MVVYKALFYSFAEKYTALFLGLVSTVVISRIVTPHDIGIISIGLAVTSFLAQIREFGIATYIIQEKDLTDEKFRTAFSLSIFIATAVMLLLILCSRPIASFYGEPGLANVLIVLALSLIVIPFNSLCLAMLRRDMKYRPIYHMTVVGMICYAVTSIVLAKLGAAYMALAWGNLALCLGNFAVAFLHRPKQYSYLPLLKSWRPIARFGLYTTTANLVNEASMRAPDLIVGRAIGITPAGLFSRSSGLPGLVNQTVVSAALPVALSTFALRYREGTDINGTYLSGLARLSAVAWPALLFVVLMTFPIVRILFGWQWDATIPLARILAIGAFFSSLIALPAALYRSIGAAKQLLRVQLLVAPVQVVAVLIAAQFGLAAVCIAGSCVAAYELTVSQIIVNNLLGLRMVEILGALAKSALVTIASLPIPLLILMTMPPTDHNLWVPFILSGLGGVTTWFLAILVTRHPLMEDVQRGLVTLRAALT